jgi:hypothetical protein
MDLTDAQRSQKQWLRPLFNILNKKAKNIALILASVNAISSAVFLYLLNVTKGGGKTQRNLSNPLSYKEGATFYFMLNYLAFKIDNTRILQSISQTFLDNILIYFRANDWPFC